MKKKKGGKKQANVCTPLEKLNKKETLMHYNAVLMEDIDSKFKLVLERVESLDAKFDKKIDNLEFKIEKRLSTLEHAVKSNSERLSTLELAVGGNSDRLSTLELAFRGMKDDMIDMERRICSKINRITERCENQCRLAALEASQ